MCSENIKFLEYIERCSVLVPGYRVGGGRSTRRIQHAASVVRTRSWLVPRNSIVFLELSFNLIRFGFLY